MLGDGQFDPAEHLEPAERLVDPLDPEGRLDPARFDTALILNPVLNSDQLMKAIAMEFGLQVKGMDRLETVAALTKTSRT